MPTLVDRIQGLSGSLAFKPPVRVVTTTNIVLNGLQTLDDIDNPDYTDYANV